MPSGAFQLNGFVLQEIAYRTMAASCSTLKLARPMERAGLRRRIDYGEDLAVRDIGCRSDLRPESLVSALECKSMVTTSGLLLY